MAHCWNEHYNIPVWEVWILFSFTWKWVLPVWDLSVIRLLAVTNGSVWNTIPSGVDGVHPQIQSARLFTVNSINSTDNQQRKFCTKPTWAEETTRWRLDARTVSAALWNICCVWALVCLFLMYYFNSSINFNPSIPHLSTYLPFCWESVYAG